MNFEIALASFDIAMNVLEQNALRNTLTIHYVKNIFDFLHNDGA